MAAIEVSRRRRAEEQRAGYEIAAIKARRIYNESEQCCGHAYLKYKHVPSCRGLHVTDDGTLLVPMFDGNGKLWSIQRIYQDGELFHKRFLAGGKVSGMFFTIQGSDTIGICEGLATGLSIRKETGHTIYVAFSAGNLKAVSKAVRTRHPHARVIFFADNDLKTEGNPGVKKADEAARAIHADLAIPPINGDWNDFLEGGSRGRDS
jgi:putative DNA primase/helicase